ncbi:DNA mismatch repair endonuclease MutL [Candidatus Peregrinibacteria bacterium]|nr:DNA mismatch repair endonuclease MutL [Candidatus Peregrinibacteria bacterium]
MPIIKQLPEHLINQIAAGEVVERPASVVKELVENSIDAGADKITIEVNDGGDTFLRITDNGLGMDKDDALLAFSRHATSKISSADDLFNIYTLGFRGEALATIAAVSYVSLQTKKRGAIEGTTVQVEGGNIHKVSSIGCPEGTQIEVRQLFFNTPARKKYLKNAATEYGHILSMITGISLAFPNISFTLIHDEKTVFDLPATDDDFVRIRAVLGRSVADELVPVFYGHSKIHLKGYIGKPFIARANRNSQYFFVNQREVKSHVLSYAVKQSYHSLLPKEKHPVFLLYFTLDPESVDVNVHPRKLEVRFRDEKEIFSIITQACSKALETHVLAPILDGNKTSEYNEDRVQQSPLVLHDKPLQVPSAVMAAEPVAVGTVEQALEFTQRIAGNPINENYVSVELPFGNSDESASGNENILERDRSSENEVTSTVNGNIEDNPVSGFGVQREATKEILPLAQMDRSYILCQQGQSLVIVDQHAAHERVRYTEIVEAFEKQLLSVQPLLVPENLELSHRELALLEQYGEILRTMGFELEPFGGNTIAVNAVPSYAAKLDLQPLIQGLLDDMDHQSSKGDFTMRKERALIYMACRSAVKFGDPLAPEEQKELLKKLQALALPYTCPHGRPTMITLTSDELIKRFGRNYDA